MNTLETLYFPDTKLVSDRCSPLFLLFSTTHILQPVEEGDEKQQLTGDSFMDNPFCQVHTPAPLGEDRDRFLYLLQDIRNRKDDYAAQLSQLTLASLRQGNQPKEATKNEIIGKLLKGPSAEESSDLDNNRESLWQARLVLAIGELLDREEEEVVEALMLIEDHESDLFGRLHGDESDDDDDLESNLIRLKTKMARPSITALQSRLRAWLRIAENGELPRSLVWTTNRQEIADILMEHHENQSGSPPELVVTLSLPVKARVDSETDNQRLLEFRSQAGDYVSQLHDLFAAADRQDQNERFASIQERWHSLLNSSYPEAAFGRQEISFYDFSRPLETFTGEKTAIQSAAKILAVLPL